jgi:RNA polymerase sigma-70 factor (ECF subfamily)
MQLPDHELIAHCRNGKPDDFRFLVERYQGSVFTFVASSQRDRTLAQEVTEEAFVRAFFALDKLEKPEAFHSWILGIARRVALEFLRAPHRRYEVAAPLDQTAAESVEAPPHSGLDDAIAALPDLPRRLILMRYFEQLSCQEIAARTRMPLGSVTKTLSRAYAELHQSLAAQENNARPLESRP